ncbi:oligosaccharide flippase family protein [Thalassomonas viridans]|uniref:Oligosaccharide flippase family protein n=1 Tax=Thalassomonas viridans TaxID=137584 RepID=A0AAF0C998_9GAMM|nr:oligosaccharide flippase family protein [Thalassomonas viridans]WDE05010.1 oligosaccharide flippase family protein [Thalassomonas viridans]
MSNQLIKHSMIYSLFQLFMIFAGLISFPILTKSLTTEEYGILGLITVTLSMLASFGKLGIQHGIVRYREDYEKTTFISNITYLAILGPFALALVLMAFSLLLYRLDYIPPDYIDIVLIVIFLAFAEQIRNFIVNYFISVQESALVAKIRIMSKLITMIFTLSVVVLILASAKGFVYGFLVAEIIVFSLTLYIAKRQELFAGINLSRVSAKIYKPLLLFSIPLLGLEMVSMLHAFVDRYLIKYFMEARFLGYYSAYYNMATMLAALIIGGLTTAIVPAYLKTWNEQGREKTEALLNRIFNLLLLMYPIIVISLWVVSKELFELLTTKEYVAYAYLLPLIAMGVLLQSAMPLFSAGLKIKKASMTMFYCVIFSAVLNLVLNLIFIPLYGLTAAAVTTTVSYACIAAGFAYFGSGTLTPKVNLYVLLRSCIYAGIFLLFSPYIQHEINVIQLILKVSAGVVYFCLIFILFEKPLTLFLFNSVLKRIPGAKHMVKQS